MKEFWLSRSQLRRRILRLLFCSRSKYAGGGHHGNSLHNSAVTRYTFTGFDGQFRIRHFSNPESETLDILENDLPHRVVVHPWQSPGGLVHNLDYTPHSCKHQLCKMIRIHRQ